MSSKNLRRKDGGVLVEINIKSRRTSNKNYCDFLTAIQNNLTRKIKQNYERETVDDLALKNKMNVDEKIKTTKRSD